MGLRRLGAVLALSALSVSLMGCNYARKRADDFRDIWVFSVGGTHTLDASAVIPPSLGLHADALWFGLGAITHNGMSAELLDGRGTFIGPESRTRISLLFYQWWRVWQAYHDHFIQGLPEPALWNQFKDPTPPDYATAEWLQRVSTRGYTRWFFPAGRFDPRKRLLYQDEEMQGDWVPLHRGWNHLWTVQAEAAAGIPLTHISFYMRVGFDVSEVMDFVLGIFTYDMYGDDVDYGLQPPPGPAPAPGVMTREFAFPDVLFNYDSSALTAEGHARVDEIAAELRNVQVTGIRVVGHCCDLGTPEYNYELGLRRAQTVAGALEARDGFGAAGMQVISLGETAPAVPNTSEENRRLNRRVIVEVSYTAPAL